MWAEACNLLDEAEQLHRRFFRLGQPVGAAAAWEPPVDVFEDDDDFFIVVALPGVAADRIEVAVETGVLVISAERALPLGGRRCAVRRLEIPYGRFQRRIQLPPRAGEVRAREFRDGCLLLSVSKRRAARGY